METIYSPPSDRSERGPSGARPGRAMGSRATPTHEPKAVVPIRPARSHPIPSTPRSPGRGTRFAVPPEKRHGRLPGIDSNVFDGSRYLFESYETHRVGEADELSGDRHRRSQVVNADAGREATSPLMADVATLLPIGDRGAHPTLRPGLHRRHQS